MQKVNPMLPYWTIMMIGFYILPLAIQNTGIGMIILLFAIPLICFVCALIYGIRHGFNFVFGIIAALLFLPSILIFYNASAWVYAFIYLGLALLGNGIGQLLSKARK